MNNFLVVAPHPDDETLGAGGTLLKHKNNGDNIFWLIVTNIHHENGWSEEAVQKRQIEISQVSKMYGFEKVFKLDFPTTLLDTIPFQEIIFKISAVIHEIKPTTIYMPNHSDVHTDHQITFKAAISCCKNFRAPFIKKILMYECLSESEFTPALRQYAFIPNVFIDISEYLNRKLDIFNIYHSEIMEPPFPRSVQTITGLAGYRGTRIGAEYAEAFTLIHEEL